MDLKKSLFRLKNTEKRANIPKNIAHRKKDPNKITFL